MEDQKTIEQRLPPQDLDAERSVLGAILIDKDSFFKVSDIVVKDDFYDTSNQIIFEAMSDLAEKSEPIDILTVSGHLRNKKLIDRIGGDAYLTKITGSVPSAIHIEHYAKIVYKKAIMRSLIKTSYDIGQLGYQEDRDVDEIVDDAEKYLLKIASRSASQSFESIDKDRLTQAFERIDHLSKNRGEVRGVPTGFSGIDNLLSGLQDSDLVILAARPSLGKSAMAVDIARNVAVKGKIPVGIFSLEMSTDQVVDRMISATSHVDLWKIRTGKGLKDSDFNNINNALGTLSEAPIFVDDKLTSSILQMKTMARKLQAEKGLGLLIIDYLQLIQPNRRFDNLAAEVSEISRSLKSLARELEIPVLALSQLSREVEKRGGRPRLSDLRDSGAIEQDADVVMFIHREIYKDDPEAQIGAQIYIEKHRNGPTGKVDLVFNKQYASFQDVEKTLTEAPLQKLSDYTDDLENIIDPNDIPS